MNKIATILISLLVLIVAGTADAASREEEKVAAATDVIDQLSRIPEQTIPASLLSRAYAVAFYDIWQNGDGISATQQ